MHLNAAIMSPGGGLVNTEPAMAQLGQSLVESQMIPFFDVLCKSTIVHHTCSCSYADFSINSYQNVVYQT